MAIDIVHINFNIVLTLNILPYMCGKFLRTENRLQRADKTNFEL